MPKKNKRTSGQNAAIALIKKSPQFILMVPSEDPSVPPRVFAQGYTTPSQQVDYVGVALLLGAATREMERQANINQGGVLPQLEPTKSDPQPDYGDEAVSPDAPDETGAKAEG